MNLRTARPREWPELLTADDVGAILGKSARTAQRLMSAGELGPYIRIGATRYLRRDTFQAALQEREARTRRKRSGHSRGFVAK